VKRREVRHSTASHEDYVALIDHLVETRGLATASAVDAKLERAIASLALFSGRGRIVPELRHAEDPEYRELISGAYRVVYRIVEDEVWIVAIVDGHRNLEELLLGRAQRFRIAKMEP
jgi:toxin ParE1/3/4